MFHQQLKLSLVMSKALVLTFLLNLVLAMSLLFDSVPSGRGPAYSGRILWTFCDMPIALTHEGRSLVDDVCEYVHD